MTSVFGVHQNWQLSIHSECSKYCSDITLHAALRSFSMVQVRKKVETEKNTLKTHKYIKNACCTACSVACSAVLRF
jgi:hypothetical protein